MSINRITSGFQTSQSINFLQHNQRLLTMLQQKISSGKNILDASDDPVGYSRLLDIGSATTQDERYIKNIQDGKAELNMAETAFQGLNTILTRAKELALQGANDTNGTQNRNAMAAEIDTLINQAVQIGNTNISGKYIFGGMNTTTVPFARTAPDTITYAGTGTPSANPTYQRQIEIAPGIQVPINANGGAIFGTVTAAAGPAPPYTTGAGILQTLDELRNDLLNNNTAEIQARLDNLNTHIASTLDIQTQLGSVTNQMDLTLSRIEDRKVTLDQQLSSIQEIDYAKTIADYNFQDNIYQSSLGVTARVLQTTLLNYLQ